MTSAVNFNFSINEATSRETVRHEDQKSVSKISRENTQNNIKENERQEKEHMRQHMIINIHKDILKAGSYKAAKSCKTADPSRVHLKCL